MRMAQAPRRLSPLQLTTRGEPPQRSTLSGKHHRHKHHPIYLVRVPTQQVLWDEVYLVSLPAYTVGMPCTEHSAAGWHVHMAQQLVQAQAQV